MANMKFESWQEAYEYQMGSRTDSAEPLFMNNYGLFTGVSEIDDVSATMGQDIVWLVTREGSPEYYIQYGVGRNQKWYMADFDGFSKKLEYVEGSLKEFSQLPRLIETEPEADIIYRHIEVLFEVFEFLKSGRINKDDVVSYQHMNNAGRMISFAKSELERFNRIEDEYEQAVEDEEYYEDECCEEAEEWNDEEEYDEYFDEYFGEYFGEDFDDEVSDEDLDDLFEDEDFEAELEDDEDYDLSKYDESDEEYYEQLSLFDEDEFMEEVEEHHEEILPFIIRYGVSEDIEDMEELHMVGTEREAIDKYNEIILMDFTIVELYQVKRVYSVLS